MAHDPVGSGHSGSSVEDWLRNHAVSNGALPANLRPESVAFLQRLIAASVHRDATEQQLATDAQRRAAQHATEQVVTEDVLQQCGLAPNSMPTAVSGSLGAPLPVPPVSSPQRQCPVCDVCLITSVFVRVC